MQADRFTIKSQEALQAAQRLAEGRGNPQLTPEHLLAVLLEQDVADVRGPHRVTSQSAEDQYGALEKFGRDLAEAAEQGKLDPVIGRDDEIRRVIQVLSRRTKNNPVHIGGPG